MRNLFRSLSLGVLLLSAPAALTAQQSPRGTVAGRVVEEATSQPLSDVQVMIVGTTLGARTNEDGRFTIANVPAGAVTVRASRIGYGARTQPATVTVGATTTVNFTMSPSAVALDQIVVTGTAGAVERRSQPAVVASVDAAEIVDRGAINSVQDVLAARVPGVTVDASSGSSGSSQRIRIRGASSISLSNEPLVFIDGVRANSSNTGLVFTGGQTNSRLFDLNPEEIESIEVVKGPAAATLYGSDASAGVIQIITKRGRAGSNRFTQSLTLEHNTIQPNFTPFSNYGVCTTAMVAPGAPQALCQGRAVNDVVEDNPLVRTRAFRTGRMRSIGYNASGGGQAYGFFVSVNRDDEEGTLPNNGFLRQSGRFNFNFTPSSKLAFDAGLGMYVSDTDLPQNDNNVYGFLGGGYLGRPTLGNYVKRNADGTLTGGFYAANREIEAISSIEASYLNRRVTPSLTANYSPTTWFSNRLTIGADLSAGTITQFFPRNDAGWYQGNTNTGSLEENRVTNTIYTLDYLGRVDYGITQDLGAKLSFGTQVISEMYDRVTGTGVGFVTNANRVVGAATEISASQTYSENRSIGLLSQVDLEYADKLFVQLGARLDQNSSFGQNAEPFFLPKVGVSYVVSEESFWSPLANMIPTLRLRAAYGETGRSPTAGASLETYAANPFAIYDGGSAAGVTPSNPGNQNLKAERGKEFEGGFDAGFLNDRVGVELTYFDKRTTDLLLRTPIPPSSGFSSFPFANIGKVRNSGVEYALRATLLDRANLTWDARVSGSTLNNELVDLGSVEPFGTLERFEEGHPLGAYFTRKVVSVDTAANRVTVSDSLEYVGSALPTNEGSFISNVKLFNIVTLGGQLEWKRGFTVYNNTAQFRDRSFRNSRIGAQCATATTEEECLRRFGPFQGQTRGEAVAFSQVNEEYLEKGDFVRLREISATVEVPERYARLTRASALSFTVAGRNLALWTDYTGADPEVLSDATSGFLRTEFFTVPPSRRLVVKANVTF
jgi:TonB-dependent starch-binding outer membrane protein SusC